MSAPARRILIVDDEPDNLALLATWLREEGHRVFAAESGERALANLATSAPEIVLLDVLMPGLDGLETCRRLKAHPEFGDVPVLFLSAISETDVKVKGFAAGAVDYVTKPLQRAEVAARVRTHLQLRTLQVALETRNEELDRAVQRLTQAEQGLERALRQPVLIVDREGVVQFCTDAAEQALTRVLGARFVRTLPSEVQRWCSDLARRASPLELAGASGRRLAFTFVPDAAIPDRALLAIDEKSPPASPERLQVLGLTPREAEILFWIAQGKTSPEIAIILSTAPATVQRHVANFLPKLGVETRLAAALRAMEVLGTSA
jgi:DNA-binding response OmpR family regulator/DNA-binding CsgD family transcriptional regulator